MLRQVIIFHKTVKVFTHSFGLALDNENLKKVFEVVIGSLEIPIPGKIFNRSVGDYQVFHRYNDGIYCLLITDMIDTRAYIDNIMIKVIRKFKELFPDPETIKDSKKEKEKEEFTNFLGLVQKDLHSKIVIMGPANSGKSTFYNLIKSGPEKQIMNFAVSSLFVIENLSFDIWNFRLKDNFSPLWPKFVSGADLIILLFDASNYNLKVLEYFTKFRKLEGKFSRFIVVANKRDLVGATDIERIKTELNENDLKEISLVIPNSKNLINDMIREGLNLKRILPKGVDSSINKALKLESEGKIISAIKKYKELIDICVEYQDFARIEEYQQKLKELKSILEGQTKSREGGKTKSRDVIERKTSFTVPEQKTFTQKVQIKTLPKKEQQSPTIRHQPRPIKKQPQQVRLQAQPIKTQLQQLRSQTQPMKRQPHPEKQQPAQPKLAPQPLKQQSRPRTTLKKLTLNPSDFKIDLTIIDREARFGKKYDKTGKRINDLEISKQLIEKHVRDERQLDKVKDLVQSFSKTLVQEGLTPKPLNREGFTSKPSVSEELDSKSSTTEQAIEKPLTPDDLKDESDYPKGLQKMISQKGSVLSQKLCERYVEEIKGALNRQLTFDDLLVATDLFIKHENIE